jgi:IS4 transposase
MLINLSREQADVSQLATIYRARWAVEIQFRAWKQALNLSNALNRKSNEHHLQALVLAELDAFDPDPRHVERDKRTRKSPAESGILALT